MSDDGTFTYDPNGAFDFVAAGAMTTDTFTYTLGDGTGGSCMATVTVDITGIDDPPTAVANTATVAEDDPATPIDVLLNDVDVDGGPISISGITQPTNGTAVITGGGTGLTYQPDPDFCNDGVPTDDFTYTLTPGGSSTTVAVTVTCVDDPPTAVADTATVAEDAPATTIDVLINDTDPDGGPISVTSVTQPANGTVVITNGGADLTYQPDPNYCNGGVPTDDFNYTLAPGGSSTTVAVTVTCVNDAPTKTAGGGGPAAFTEGGGPVAIDPGVTVTDIDSANLVSATVTITNLLDAGQETLAANTGGTSIVANYVAPTLTLTGSDTVANFQAVLRSVTYNNTSTSPDETNRTISCLVNDGTSNSNTLMQTVTVTGTNSPPTANTDTFDTVGNTELVVGTGGPGPASLATVAVPGGSVLANDTDPDMTLPFVVVSATGVATDSTGPTFDIVTTNGGTVSMDTTGRFSYLPPRGVQNLMDSFTYGMQDADGAGATATVNINIINFRVWYVHNDPAGEILNPVDGPNFGRSDDPFDTLAAAGAAHGANDLICVYEGTGTNAGMNAGIVLAADNVTLHGEHQGCQVNQSLNGQPAPEVLLAPTANRHAHITHTAGNAITVDATGGNVTGIEIRGVDLDATGGNALDVTSGGASNVEVLFENSLVNGASGEGVDVNHPGSGLATINVNNIPTFAATGNAFDARATGTGNLHVAFDNVGGITSANAAGAAIFVEDAGPGLAFVTSFSNNTVLGTSNGEGVRILGAIFDSDPTDADFDPVAGGDLTVGTVVDRTRGGVILGTPANRVSGNLGFGTVNIFTFAGAALSASGSGVAAGMPNPNMGFLLATTGGTADGISGPAVALDPLTANIQLGNISSSMSPTNGVLLDNVSGTVNISMGGIATATGASFDINGGTVSATFSGSITHSNNSPAILVRGGHNTGTVTFDTGTLNATNGTGFQFDNADGTYNFNGTSNLNGGDAGIDILNGSSGAFNFSANTAITHAGAGTAFNITNSTPTSDYNGTITDTNGLAVDIATLLAGGSARFDGQVTASGAGVRTASTAGTVHFANADLSNTATVDIFNNTAVITFADLDLNQTAGTVNAFQVNQGTANVTTTLTGNGLNSATPNRLVNVIGRTGGTVSFSGAATVQGTLGNTGINVQGNTNTNVTFNAPVDLGTSAANRITGGGVRLNGNTASTVTTFNSLDIFTNAIPGIVATDSGVLDTATLAGLVNINTTGNGAAALDLDGIVANIVIDGVTCNTNTNCIDLTNLAATSVSRLAGLGLTCTGGTCFNGNAARTVEVTGATNTLTATNAAGVDLTSTTIGANHVTFQSLSVDAGGAANLGIRLDTTGAGDFVVTGDGTTTAGGNGTGGTIENVTGSDAIILDTTGGLVSLQNMIVEDIAHPNDAVDALQTRRFHDGIHGENVNGGLRLQSVTMRRFSDHAILGALFSDGTDFTNWNGLELRDSVFENANRFHIANRGDDADEGVIRIRGLTGTMVVDNCTVRLGGRGLDIYTPAGAGTLDATIQRNTFENLYKEFVAGAPRNVGGRGVSFEARGSHDMVVRIGDPAQANPALGNTFTNNFTASVVVLGQVGGLNPHTGDIDTVISHNNFVINDHTTAQLAPGNLTFDFPQGGVSLNPAGGTYDAIVSFNLFDEVMHAAGGLGQLTLGLNGGAVQAHVHDNTFRLPWDGSVQIRAEGTSSAAVLFEDNTYTDGMVGSAADDVGFATQSPFNPVLVNVRAGGDLDLTMRREVFPQHDIVFTAADRKHSIEIEVQADSAANALDLHLLDNQGPEGYHLKQFAGSFELFQGASASAVPGTIIDDNGNTGGGGSDLTDPPLVVVTGTITATATAPTLPVIVIP
jgi:hypothetical protein